MPDSKRLSRFLALMLRHKAADFGLALDADGFTDLDAVWGQVQRKYGSRYSRADFDALLADSNRYEVSGQRVRALYGHSRVREIAYPPAVPPDLLYHGTVAAALDDIRTEGLTSQGRQYVHLSTGIDRANEVAGRRGKPVLLTIKAGAAHAAGIVFHHPEPQHYLVKSVPPGFIVFPG